MIDKAPKCKITVVKRTHNGEVFGEYLDEAYAGLDVCDCSAEGTEYFVSMPWEMPEGMCAWAWADIRQQIVAVMAGAHLPGMKKPGTAIAGCTDWLRPVLFYIEKLD